MAYTDKNLIITPNVGSAGQDPTIAFSGADNVLGAQTLQARIYPTSNGTLSFEGSAGQLFSITNSLTGTIFSVNDVSGIPSIEVFDTGIVRLAQYGGRVLIGNITDNGVDTLQFAANGSSIQLPTINSTGNVVASGTYTSNVVTGTAPFIVNSTTLVANLNADLLDGQSGAYYLDWTNVTNKPDPVITVTLTGDVTGSASATLTDLASGTVSIATTVASDTVVLGTDTTGNYVASITNGSFITGGNGGSEGAALTLAVDATSAATASKVVSRDTNASFSANIITASLSGNATTATTLQTARNINGVSFNGSADITITASTTQTLTRGTYLTGSNFNGGTATTWAVDATDASTASKVVARDANGSFAANVVTATTFSGSLDWSNVANKPDPVVTVTLTGDVTGSASATLTDLASGTISIATTVASDTVALGTDTTGNYVASITNGSFITGGNGGSEGAALTLAVDATSAATASKVVSRDSNASFAANVITATTFSGSGASLTALPAGQLSGTIPSGVLGNSSLNIGTTSVALNRSSGNLGLTGISSIALPGSSSGNVTLQPVAAAGTTTITLPATTGTVVTTGDTGTVTSAMIADGTIVNGDISASAAIATSKIAGLATSATTDTTNASNISSGTLPGDRGVTAGSSSSSFVEYNGTTATAGQFDGGSTAPSGTTRLNYGGYLYATRFYGDGSNLTSIPNSATTASSVSGASTIVARDANGSFAANVVTATTFSGSGASLTALPAGQLSGTIPAGVLGNSSLNIGTTSVALNRASNNLGLTGISSISLPGATSGTVTLQPAAAAGSTTITLPATTGTVVTTGDTGTVTNAMLAGSIANAKLTNSSITVNGTAISLGASGTITASTTNALTISSGLSGTSFNGGSAVTIAVDSTVALRADTHFIGTTSVALNRASSNLGLTGITSVAMPGSSSGTVTLQPAAAAGTTTITLPATTGTVVTTGDTGTVTNTMLAGSIANAKLTNSSITVNGTAISLGASGTITASTTNALTIGSGLSGSSFNGGSAVTIAVDSTVALRADTHFIGTTSVALNRSSGNLGLTGITSVAMPGSSSGTVTLQPAAAAGTTTITLPATTGTVVTTGDTGTVTNTMLAGSIANAKLTNSTITVNGSAIALGGSATVTANTTNTLTIGNGLSGTSFNGSAAVTIDVSAVENSTSAAYYPVFATSQGTAVVLGTRSTLTYNPGTGVLAAADFNTTSDATLKENVVAVDGLALLDQVRPVAFNWKDTGRKSYGVIAQEIEQILPELVDQREDGIKGVSYIPLIALLIDAVKNLDARVKQLESK